MAKMGTEGTSGEVSRGEDRGSDNVCGAASTASMQGQSFEFDRKAAEKCQVELRCSEKCQIPLQQVQFRLSG